MDSFSSEILTKSTAIRTYCLPEVKKVLNDIPVTYDEVIPYQTGVIQWLNPVIDLSSFHVYPTNGITEGLNWWYGQENRAVTVDPGDYQWVEPKSGEGSIHYLSVPSSIDGNFRELPGGSGAIALDLAYVGSTSKKNIVIDQRVEFVFFSLSKSFGVPNLRTGWLFTRKPQPQLEKLIYGAKYYNYFAASSAEAIIEKFSVDYVYERLRQRQQELCAREGLEKI